MGGERNAVCRAHRPLDTTGPRSTPSYREPLGSEKLKTQTMALDGPEPACYHALEKEHTEGATFKESMRFRAAVPLLLVLAAVLPGLVKPTAASTSTSSSALSAQPASVAPTLPGVPATANPQVVVFPPTPGGTCTVEYFEPN